MKKSFFILLLFVVGLPVFAAGGQDAGGLDPSIKKATGYLKKKLPNDKTKLAIFSLNSSTLENYFVDELTDGLRNATKLQIVDRTQLAAIAAEMGFQTSGEVSDDDQAMLGKKAGARRIISVSITHMGNQRYRFRVRAVDVETAELYASNSFTVKDKMIEDMLKQPPPPPPPPPRTTPPPPQTTVTTTPPPSPRGDTSNPISLQANDTWVSQTMSLSEMWFTLRPSANGRLTVETDGNLDTKMEIYDGNSMLKQDDDGGSGLNAKIMIDASSGKNYRIKVWEYERKTGGNYRIRASLSQITVIDLTNNSESLSTINVNTSYKCRFATANSTVTLFLDVPSGYSSVRIYSEGSRSINGMVLNSVGMALALTKNLNEAVNHVLASNTSGGNINLRVTTTTEKKMYILLTEANDNTGEFTLTVEGIR